MPPALSNDDDHNDFDVENVEEIGLNPDNEEETGGEEGNKTALGMAGYKVELDNRIIPYVGMIVAAMVLLIAILVPQGKSKNQSYTISLTVITMVFCFVGIYFCLKPELYDRPCGSVPYIGQLTYGSANAQFLFLWNFIGAGILTFNGPFTDTSNGYFGAWGLVIFSLMALGVTTRAMQEQAGALGYFNGLLVASIIQVCAVSPEISGTHSGESIFSLVVCMLTMFGVLAFNAYPSADTFKFPFFALFSIVWVVLACMVTFRGPFLNTGNGYFSAWFGCALCVFSAVAVRPE